MKDVQRFFDRSIFKEMLFLWADKNYTTPTQVNDILQQNIWFNSHVKKQNKWIYEKDLYRIGIKKIIDLYDLDLGSFMSYQQFEQEYPGMINFLTYAQIIASVPRVWKRILQVNAPSVNDDQNVPWSETFTLMSTKGKMSRVMYNQLRDEVAIDNSILLLLWNNDLRLGMTQNEFDKLFKDARKLVTSTKYRYFQYRILVRALTLNIHVSKWDPNVSFRCSFCNDKPETTIHIFVECPYVSKLWDDMKKWFAHIYQLSVSIAPSNIIFNNYKGPSSDLINMYILLTKFNIYKSKVTGVIPRFNLIITDVNRIQNVERYIANNTGKLVKHMIRWNVKDLDIG